MMLKSIHIFILFVIMFFLSGCYHKICYYDGYLGWVGTDTNTFEGDRFKTKLSLNVIKKVIDEVYWIPVSEEQSNFYSKKMQQGLEEQGYAYVNTYLSDTDLPKMYFSLTVFHPDSIEVGGMFSQNKKTFFPKLNLSIKDLE